MPTRNSYIADFGGQARYANSGYQAGTNGRFSIFNHYQGLEGRAAENSEVARYLNEQMSPFQWDEMAWQKAIGALELDEDGKQALIARTHVNPHPWPIEAEHDPWATAGEIGSIGPNPATGQGAYGMYQAGGPTTAPINAGNTSNVQYYPGTSTPIPAGTSLASLSTPQSDQVKANGQVATGNSIFSGLPVQSSDLPAALQPLDASLAAAVGGDGTIFGLSPLVAIGIAVGGFFLLSSMGGAKHV